MSKFFHLAKRPLKKIQRKRKFSFSFMNLPSLNFVVISLIIVFAVTYLVQINGLATKGYQIKELEKTVDGLKQEKADLELEALSLQSMGVVKAKVNELGMVITGEQEYLNPTPVAVAR